MKLGKLAPKSDPRTLKLSKYLNIPQLPLWHPQCYQAVGLSPWGMMLNDTIGDCTIAGAGHGIMDWTYSTDRLFTPTDADIIGAYSAVTGYIPGDPNTDNGAYCLDVLKYWRTAGIGGHKINSFVSINTKVLHEVQYGIALFGLVYIGIELPLLAQSQPTEWATSNNLLGPNAPGSWGGHCVIVVGYDREGLDLITWGQRIRMTWHFWQCYVSEAYAIISTDYVLNNKAPNGLNMFQLQKDLQILTKVE